MDKRRQFTRDHIMRARRPGGLRDRLRSAH
jgi:hypothetical protein